MPHTVYTVFDTYYAIMTLPVEHVTRRIQKNLDEISGQDVYQVQLFCKPFTAGRNLHTHLFHSHNPVLLTKMSPYAGLNLKLNHQTAQPKCPHFADEVGILVLNYKHTQTPSLDKSSEAWRCRYTIRATLLKNAQLGPSDELATHPGVYPAFAHLYLR